MRHGTSRLRSSESRSAYLVDYSWSRLICHDIHQMQSMAKSAGADPKRPRNVTIVSTLQYVYRENGLKGLYRGVTPRIGLGIWQTVCMVSFADYVKAWYVADSTCARQSSHVRACPGSKASERDWAHGLDRGSRPFARRCHYGFIDTILTYIHASNGTLLLWIACTFDAGYSTSSC